jgi:pimeloyl-ACP methyl ester carboxylesterase
MNIFPADFSGGLTGFGGDPAKNKAQHRAAIRRTPVVLVHGNATNSTDAKFGMQPMQGFLRDIAGYQPSEIWAMNYLGENNTLTDMPTPHRKHIDEFRNFVDAVKDYLGVQKLDFIAHSLGCGMVNAYLRGLKSDGGWDSALQRLNVAGTFVALAGATYGLGNSGVLGDALLGEFQSGSEFEKKSHMINNIVDDTPRGSNNKADQSAPIDAWRTTSTLDSDPTSNQINYVAIIAAGDFVDMQLMDTSRREGAQLNQRFNLGIGLDGHEKVIKSSTVFNAFMPYLNKIPPMAPTSFSIDKDSGSYPSGLTVGVTVSPPAAKVKLLAERTTRHFMGGFIDRTVLATENTELANGGTKTLPSDGVWEVLFQASGADDLRRVYGVGVTIPEVKLLTDNATPFQGNLQVTASTTSGALFHSTDRQHWLAGSEAIINRTATVSFIAIDSNGAASPIASRAYHKAVAWTDQQTATLTAHFLAQRVVVSDYVAWGLELGFNAVLTLYKVDGHWVRNPEASMSMRTRSVAREAALAAPRQAPALTANKANGDYPGAIDVTLHTASTDSIVHYTRDGSDPSDSKNLGRLCFQNQKSFTLSGVGHHAILCYVQEGDGHGRFEAFAWSINN